MVYRCGFAADSQHIKWYKENVNTEPSTDELANFLSQEDYLTHALGNVKTLLDDIAGKFSGQMKVFLTGKGNFRESIATILPYKGTRDPTHKPKYYDEIRRYMIEVWGAVVVDEAEADDAIATAQFVANDDSTVIVSTDKDLDMIPGNHYNFVRKEFYYVDQADADINFFRQMLIGDRVDNIPGIDGIGTVKAEALIKSCNYDLDRIREEVKTLYKKQYGDRWESAYFEVGTLLWMIRDSQNPECALL